MSTTVVIRLNVDNSGAVTKVRQVRDELEKVPGSAQKASTGLTTLKNVLAGVGVAFGAIQIKNFIADSIRLAAEEQQVMTRLAATLNTLGVSYGSVSGELQEMFKRIQETTRFSDDQAAAAFQKLVIITGDYGSALKLIGPVLDMAIGGTMDLETAATLAGKAAAGYTGILARYGIVLDEATKKQLEHATAAERTEIIADALNKRFGGQAQADIKSYGGQVAQLRNQWEELKEALGAVILQSVDLTKINKAVGDLADIMPEIVSGVKILAPILATMWAVERIDKFSRFLDGLPGKFRLANAAALDLKFTVAALVGIGLSEWFDSWNRTLEGPSARAIGAFQRAVKDAGMSVNGLLASFPEAKDKTEAWTLAFARFIAETKNGTQATGQWVRVAALYNAEVGESADVTVRAGDAATTTAGTMADLNEAYLSVSATAGQFNTILYHSQDYLTQAAAAADRYMDILRGSGGMGSVYDAGAWSDNSWYWDSFSDAAEESFDYIGGMFSDLLGKGFAGELDSFADLFEEVWQDIAKSLVGILGNAFQTALEGGAGFFQQIGQMLNTTLGQLAFGVAGAGMMYSGYQQGGVGGFLQGAIGGAMSGASIGSLITPGIGTVIGAIVGGIVGGALTLFGSGSDDPETYVRNLGLTSGMIDTRGHQGYGTELRELWIRQQQGIMRSYISAYRDVLRLFEDESLFDLIGETPVFNTSGWMGMGADSLAQYLEQEFWPVQFMNMFRDAISAGLEGFGVTNATISQLWTELEALPGEDRMGALTTYVSSLVGLSNLMAEMDWNAILDAVGQDSLTQFMAGMEEIAHSIDVLMYAMDDMTLLERAEQAQEIEQLITQVRQAEIQYLQQLQSMQDAINQSVASMLEQIAVGDMGPEQTLAYYQEQYQQIWDLLASGTLSSPEAVQQAMADLLRYQQLIMQSMGSNFFEPMDIMGWGQTWADFYSNLLTEAQGYSDAYFEQFRDEIRAANDALIEAIRDLIDALTDFGGEAGEGAGGGAGNANPYVPGEAVYSPSVNVFIEGSMSALRPFVRAEIRDSMAGRSRGIN